MDEKAVEFDILKALKTENFNTKPNLAKFLKTYVQSIRIAISNGKVDLWPKIHYDIAKCIVRFKDNLTVVKYYFSERTYFIWNNFTEIAVEEKNTKELDDFFEALHKFKFIRDGNEDVKVFSSDICKTNQKLEAELNCIKENDVLFIDHTPLISVSTVI